MPAKLLHGLVMFTWSVFFFWLYFIDSNQLAKLLHPKLWWLVLTGGAILLLFSVISFKTARTHHHTIPLRWSWPSVAIMLVPLAYCWSTQSAQLGSRTFLARTTTTPSMPSPAFRATPNTSPQQPMADNQIITSLSQVAFNSLQLNGQRTSILCQTMKNENLPEDLFICYRFRITCCAADALPIFTFVQVTSQNTLPKNDDWVRVNGTITSQTVEGRTFPLIIATSLTSEQTPSFPYIY